MSKQKQVLESRFSNSLNKFNELSNPTIKEKKEKKISKTINVNRNIVKEYMELAFSYFKKIGQIGGYSTSAFFEVGIETLEQFYIAEYGKLEDLDDSDLKFFAKRGPADKDTLNRYNHENIKPVMFTISKEYYDRYLVLMNTYYKNELTDFRSYGNSFYFYDFFEQLKKLKLDQ